MGHHGCVRCVCVQECYDYDCPPGYVVWCDSLCVHHDVSNIETYSIDFTDIRSLSNTIYQIKELHIIAESQRISIKKKTPTFIAEVMIILICKLNQLER